MDTHTVGRRNDNNLIICDEDSSGSDESSEKHRANGVTILNLSSQDRDSVLTATYASEIERKQKGYKKNYNGQIPTESSLNRLKSYQLVRADIKKALENIKSDSDDISPELKAMKEADDFFKKLIENEREYYKHGYPKTLLTLTSGAVSYLLTFCTGTLIAAGTDMPFLSPVIIGICWTLCERFSPMIRATSRSNKHADITYPEIMQMTQRATFDWTRHLIGLDRKFYYRDGKMMTASEVLATHSLFEAWKGKVLSDDLVSHTFTIFYIIRNISLKVWTNASFLATMPGVALKIATLGLAGILAGASSAFLFQTVRGCLYEKENPDDAGGGENVVKSKDVWLAEKKLLEKKLAWLDAYIASLGEKEAGIRREGIEAMREERKIAEEKSMLISSICYEFKCLFRGKSHLTEFDNSEVSNKLAQTVNGLFAKILCLLPSALFITYVVNPLATSAFSMAQQIGLLTVAPVILILGYGVRKELELAIVGTKGLATGFASVLIHKCTGFDVYEKKLSPEKINDISPVVEPSSPVSPVNKSMNNSRKSQDKPNI